MIMITTERCEGGCVVHIKGSFEPSDDPFALVEHLVEVTGSDPLMVDLTGLVPSLGPKSTSLVRALAHAPTRGITVLIHPDLETRRALRAAAYGLPVVPSNDLVLHGRFASSLFSQQPPH